MKKLTDLKPRWEGILRKDSGESLSFDCPVCPPEQRCRLTIAFTNPVDGKPGLPNHGQHTRLYDGKDFATLTVEPSLHHTRSDGTTHWHGWIEFGQVIDIREATHFARGPKGEVVALSPRVVMRLKLEGKIR